jgi:hypothetical protein
MINEYRHHTSTASHTPDNPYEALMQTPPHEDPPQSLEETLLVREEVTALVDALEPRYRWIIEACIIEGKSLQEVADELSLSKTHVWRLRDKALEQLRNTMQNNAIIRKRVALADTWDESCRQWVEYFAEPRPDEGVGVLEAAQAARDHMVHLMDMELHESKSMEMALSRAAVAAVGALRDMGLWDTDEMVRVLCSKQHDYGHNNINRFGMRGIVVRFSDKVERLDNLQLRQAQNESIHDTITDIVGYAVVGLMLMDGTFQLELGKENHE